MRSDTKHSPIICGCQPKSALDDAIRTASWFWYSRALVIIPQPILCSPKHLCSHHPSRSPPPQLAHKPRNRPLDDPSPLFPRKPLRPQCPPSSVSLAASAPPPSDLPSSPLWPARPSPTSPPRCPDEASTPRRPLRSSPPGRNTLAASIEGEDYVLEVSQWGVLGLAASRPWAKKDAARCRRMGQSSLPPSHPHAIFPEYLQCGRILPLLGSMAKPRRCTGSRRSLTVSRTFSSFR